MMKFSKDEILDWRKKITLNFTNIYGDVGKRAIYLINPTFKVSEIKKYSDGNIDIVEKWSYYSDKKYISFYQLEENELILIDTKEEEL